MTLGQSPSRCAASTLKASVTPCPVVAIIKVCPLHTLSGMQNNHHPDLRIYDFREVEVSQASLATSTFSTNCPEHSL